MSTGREGELPVSDEAIEAVARVQHSFGAGGVTWAREIEAIKAEARREARRAIQAFLTAEHFGIQRKELFHGDEKVGKGFRLVSPWSPESGERQRGRW